MFITRKLKSDPAIGGLAVPLLIFASAGLIWAIWDMAAALLWTAALVLLHTLFSFSVYARTRNTGYLAAGLYQLSLTAVCASMAFNGEGQANQIALVSMFSFGAWMIYQALNRRLKWRGREILEMAAAPVEERGDGFTARPRPAGSVESSKEELKAYAAFLAKHLVALAYLEKNGIVLVPVMMGQEYGALLNPRRDYSEATWVSFGYDGRVSANISREDYLRFQDDLAFDQLCHSLAQLFIDFFQLYRAGQAERIIDRLNALQMPIFA